MTGILVVRKPVGVTSFDVVAAVRRAFRVQRVGHAGTLDPGASGVLPVLVGEATKLMPYLLDQDKEYRVTARFGTTTDTLDIGGRVLTRVPVGDLSREKLASVIGQFIGRIRQVPPMYSAVHHEGQRLYELARRGVEVEREPRDVVVHRIVLEEVLRDTATLTIVCGKGTYVRVLVAELGDALGVGAVVERLVRTRVGPFTLDDAVAWEEIRAATVLGALRPPDAAIGHWPAAHLAPDEARSFVHGQSVPAAVPVSGRIRVYGPAGTLLGIGVMSPDGARIRPARVFHVDRSGTPVVRA